MQRAEERVAYTLERVLDASDSEREGISHFGFIFPVELLNGFTPHPISSQAIVGESFNMRRASRIQIRDISLPFDRLFFKKERRRKEERKKERKKRILEWYNIYFYECAFSESKSPNSESSMTLGRLFKLPGPQGPLL